MKTYKRLMVELNLLKFVPRQLVKKIGASIMSFASLLSGCAVEPLTTQTPEMIAAKITGEVSPVADIGVGHVRAWLKFCKAYENQCIPVPGKELVPYGIADEVNYSLNRGIRYDYAYKQTLDNVIKNHVKDFTQVLTLGENGTGVCIDIALAKRAELLKKGYGTKSMSVAIVSVNEVWDHAVLIVKTERGDFLLDNRFPEPVKLNSTYRRLDAIEVDGKWYMVTLGRDHHAKPTSLPIMPHDLGRRPKPGEDPYSPE